MDQATRTYPRAPEQLLTDALNGVGAAEQLLSDALNGVGALEQLLSDALNGVGALEQLLSDALNGGAPEQILSDALNGGAPEQFLSDALNGVGAPEQILSDALNGLGAPEQLQSGALNGGVQSSFRVRATDEEGALGKRGGHVGHSGDPRTLWGPHGSHLAGEDAELRLILLGKTGGGKSATGNTILGRREFESLLGPKATTLRCQRGQGSWQGRKVSVVDTPGIFDSENYSEIVQNEIRACIELSRPGPHALILVTQVGRFTAEDVAAANCVWDIFGAKSAKHTIVLFTCLEDLGWNPLQEYVQNSDNRNLRGLIRQCGNRFCGFNNKAAGAERDRQVSELMAMVQKTVFQNGGRCYVNQLYREPNLRDEHVQSFVAKNRRERTWVPQAPWSSTKSQAWIVWCCLAVFVFVILLVVHYS
ncbi:GTPase IMAP family member 1-like [Vipera latastei]